KGGFRLLDICFGIGYNAVAALDAALEANPKAEVEIIGLEKDERLIPHIQKLNPAFRHYSLVKELCKSIKRSSIKCNSTKSHESERETYAYKKDALSLKLIVGDAVETIRELEEYVEGFDCVFLDAFSPPKNPELWTREFLLDVKSVMKKGGLLATYSCARLVRDNLRMAGFQVRDGPIVGRRGPATVAQK
ncbi:hypothetical protein COY95_05285, partial [Candidatus Woesearchaeota archaeon CG_4_10_14_0_8_um_filter_47_5]